MTCTALWPVTLKDQVRALALAGCPLDLIAEAVGRRAADVGKMMRAMALPEGRGSLLGFDAQMRVLHAAGFGYTGIMKVMALASPNSVRTNFKRLGLTPNGVNARARRVLARNARRQVIAAVGYCNGARHLIDLRKHRWRQIAARSGWAHVLDLVERLSPRQVSILDLLAGDDAGPRELTAPEIAAAFNLRDPEAVRHYMLRPLVRAGVILKVTTGLLGQGRGRRVTTYKLAVARHAPECRANGIDIATGWVRSEFEPRHARGGWAQ